ncbi:MAG: hypothetical protein U0168_24010 [Nannocystaceae bacterium]
MRRCAVLLVALGGCTSAGPSREGAIPLRAMMAVRPTADGEVAVAGLIDTLARQHAQDSERTAAGGPPPHPPGPLELLPQTEYFADRPPLQFTIVRAPGCEGLARAVARAQAVSPLPPEFAAAYAEEAAGCTVVFVDRRKGFVLAPGALARVDTPADGSGASVLLFLAPEDTEALRVLTHDSLGQRLSVLHDDRAALLTATVRDEIPVGVLSIAPGPELDAQALLERLTQ